MVFVLFSCSAYLDVIKILDILVVWVKQYNLCHALVKNNAARVSVVTSEAVGRVPH